MEAFSDPASHKGKLCQTEAFSLSCDISLDFFFFLSEKLRLLGNSGKTSSHKENVITRVKREVLALHAHTLPLTSSLFIMSHPNVRGKGVTGTEGELTEDL